MSGHLTIRTLVRVSETSLRNVNVGTKRILQGKSERRVLCFGRHKLITYRAKPTNQTLLK